MICSLHLIVLIAYSAFIIIFLASRREDKASTKLAMTETVRAYHRRHIQCERGRFGVYTAQASSS